MSRSGDDLARVVARVRDGSPLPPDETAAIIRDSFSAVPRMVRHLNTVYGFERRRVLEVGSHFGRHLLFWGAGSEGVEVRPVAVRFTRALGFPTHDLNVEDGFGGIPPESFDAIHTNNLLEHLVAPHLFLVRCHRLLRPDGLLVVGHPVVPPLTSRILWCALGVRSWLSVEHVNFFTPHTARLTCERAGFDVIEQLSAGLLRFGSDIARALVPIAMSCYSICRKRPAFRYHSKRDPVFDPGAYREEFRAFRDPQSDTSAA